jgi:hypothetical protein
MILDTSRPSKTEHQMLSTNVPVTQEENILLYILCSAHAKFYNLGLGKSCVQDLQLRQFKKKIMLVSRNKLIFNGDLNSETTRTVMLGKTVRVTARVRNILNSKQTSISYMV